MKGVHYDNVKAVCGKEPNSECTAREAASLQYHLGQLLKCQHMCDFVIEMGLIWNNTYRNGIVLNGKSTVIVLHANMFHNTLLF